MQISKQVELQQAEKLLHSKRNNKMKRQPMEWENIFANRISDKGLIVEIDKEHI